MSASLNGKPDYLTYPRLSREEARAAAAQLIEMKGNGKPVDDAQLSRIQRFYLREARLLDEERHDEWYAMLADDLFYWMPLRENRFRRDKRPEFDPDSMALFDECKADIAVRIGRLASNLAWTEDPPTRHVYIVNGVEAFETAIVGEYEIHYAFVQYRNRSEHDSAMLCGRRRDLLRATGEDFQVARRMILLPQSVLLTKNLSAFF